MRLSIKVKKRAAYSAVLMAAVWFGHAAHADDIDDVRKCGAITDALKRLDCFDAIAAKLQTAANAVAAAAIQSNANPPALGAVDAAKNALKQGLATAPAVNGAWETRVEKSKIDDSTTVTALLPAKDFVQVRLGKYLPGIVVRCLENVTAFYINFGGIFVSDIEDYGSVTFRVDTKPAMVRKLSASTDNKGLGLWSGTAAIPVIRSLVDGSGLVIRVVPYTESPIVVEFDLAGARDAIAPVAKTCKWTL